MEELVQSNMHYDAPAYGLSVFTYFIELPKHRHSPVALAR